MTVKTVKRKGTKSTGPCTKLNCPLVRSERWLLGDSWGRSRSADSLFGSFETVRRLTLLKGLPRSLNYRGGRSQFRRTFGNCICITGT